MGQEKGKKFLLSVLELGLFNDPFSFFLLVETGSPHSSTLGLLVSKFEFVFKLLEKVFKIKI